MTVSVSNTLITDTFDNWRTRTNQMAYAMSTIVLTAGSTVTGNTTANGYFVANGFVGNTVTVSNTTTNVTISTASATQISNGQYFLNANGAWSLVAATSSSPTTNSVVTTAGTSLVTVDTFSMSSYNVADYTINVKDQIANNYYSSKILLTHDTGSGYLSEYSIIISNTSVGTFGTSVSSGNVNLTFTPVSTSTKVKIIRSIA
jgi:hypothetical protein